MLTKQRVIIIALTMLVPSFAYADDRQALTMQFYQGQAAALDGANKLCQMDAADLKKQLEEAKAELAKLQKPSP